MDVSRIVQLYESFADGRISRRSFMKGATALGVAGAASTVLDPLLTRPAHAAQTALTSLSSAKALPLDLAEWSFMWVNVKRADTARRSFIGGQQMYVEYMIPARVRHPFPIVLVHGGGGQGLDWMGTPDGRPGWFQHLAAEGYKVYVVDRPGHGRAPQHPDLHGGIPQRPGTMEGLQNFFIFPAPDNQDKYRRNHTQWPGDGVPGSPDVAQFIASQGGSYVQVPTQGNQGPGQVQAPRGGGAPVPANQLPAQPNAQAVAHQTWREAGAELLDKIGPAVIMTHSAGGPFGLLVAEARPELVKANVVIEGVGSPFAAGNRWGLSTIPVTYDPAVSDASEIRLRWVPDPEPDVEGYFLQEEPVRRLPKLRNIPTLFVTSPASGPMFTPGNPGAIAFLKQAGVRVAEELRLGDRGIQGNSHMMMVEKNHREVLQPILEWIDRHATGRAPAIRKRGTDSTALKLADMNHFWVGAEVQKRDYGTIVTGQMYVQHLIPEEVRHALPIVLVHGGGGQMTHYMGLDGSAGWAHYYVQAGYKVYLVDRPGHGRSPVSVDAIGQLGPLEDVRGLAALIRRGATGVPKRWPGTTGDVGDPLVDLFVAGQNAAPANGELMQRLWRTRGAELLDRIGPAVVQTHSAGGPFGWLVAAERPRLVSAVVCYEGAAGPLTDRGAQASLRYDGIPMLYLTAENSGWPTGPSAVEALNRLGARAQHLNLKDRGITGNSHFAMVESNRREVWDVIHGWIQTNARPLTPPTQSGLRS